MSTDNVGEWLGNADSIHRSHDTSLTKKRFELVWTITEGFNSSLEVPEICLAEELYHERAQTSHNVSLVSMLGLDMVFVEGDIPNPVFRFDTPVPSDGSEQLALDVELLRADLLVGYVVGDF